MSHFAKLDNNNIVTEVIVADKAFIDAHDDWYKYKQTSYTGSLRKNYAGVGYKYDEVLDAFIAPQPFSTWVLNSDTCQWEAPIPYPDDDSKIWEWDNELVNWKELGT